MISFAEGAIDALMAAAFVFFVLLIAGAVLAALWLAYVLAQAHRWRKMRRTEARLRAAYCACRLPLPEPAWLAELDPATREGAA